MKASSSSLDSLLSLFSESTPLDLVKSEIQTLTVVVQDIYSEIHKRRQLGRSLVDQLLYREIYLDNHLANVYSVGRNSDVSRTTALEHELIGVEKSKVRVSEETARDVIELKKRLWHYWIALQNRSSQFQFLR